MKANHPYEQSFESQMHKAAFELSRSAEYLVKARNRLTPLVDSKTEDNKELYVKAAEWIDAIDKCLKDLGISK